VFADDIAAIVAASSEQQVRQAQAGLAAGSLSQEATIIAPGARRVDRYAAAAANGMAATWCELDEGFRGAPCHAGAYTLPVLLAEAEHRNMSVARLLCVLAVAYELTARMATAFPFRNLTVHPHAAFATIGASAAAGLARGVNGATLANAVSAATSMTFAGPFGHAPEGALVRNAWTSAGAWIGLRTADWAEQGIAGIAETPFDVFVGVLGTDCRPEALTEGLGTQWAIANGYHKMFACCQYTHSAIEASLELRKRFADRRSEIDRIVVETHPLALKLTTTEPTTTLAAKFSIPHAVAAVVARDSAGQDSFAENSLHDVEIARLRRVVEMQPHPSIGAAPHDRPARVTWYFRNGGYGAAECLSARGGADQPFSETIIRDKIASLTGAVFPALASGLNRIVAGDAPLLEAGWRTVLAKMLEVPSP
jgi:2-methylcitrate dehydratase PrpD